MSDAKSYYWTRRMAALTRENIRIRTWLTCSIFCSSASVVGTSWLRQAARGPNRL
jgi:hypothetical protein